MAKYSVQVTTGDFLLAGTSDHIHVTLVGTDGESQRTELNNYGADFRSGQTRVYTVQTCPLGRLLLIKLEKDPFLYMPENEWFCSKVVVTTPEGEEILFPCHRWLSQGDLLELRRAKAMKESDEDHLLLVELRRREQAERGELYQEERKSFLPVAIRLYNTSSSGRERWRQYTEHTAHITSFSADELPSELRFSLSKGLQFKFSLEMAKAELKLKGLFESEESWDNFESMQNTFTFHTSPISEYVFVHWKEDAFYGYQFLNGVHPSIIRRCPRLPSNFPVREEMVHLGSCTSLQQEMEKGNVFLCDYKLMDDIPTPVMDGKPLAFTAALCLLHVNTAGELRPIAIQLGQRPSEKCPIFLPSDAELDWLLAKMFVKNADGIFHQMASHLQSTHLLCEVFAVATMRHFPAVHPLYKLLMPHFRYNLQINIVGRVMLLGPEGIASLTSLGTAGTIELMSRELAQTTYSSLCLPENIAARGLENIPNFYYRDDGLKLWKAINSYVRAMVELYYPADDQVSGDAELQRWIHDIFTKGFLGNISSGIPESLKTVQELVKFVTMVIFTASAQHAAVNNGQFDYNSCYPNTPLMLRGEPPTAKGRVTMETILGALPSIGVTVRFMSAVVILHKKHTDSVPLGSYPEERFGEPEAKHIIENFQKELSSIDESINRRNAGLVVPYNYLKPSEIENSISI